MIKVEVMMKEVSMEIVPNKSLSSLSLSLAWFQPLALEVAASIAAVSAMVPL